MLIELTQRHIGDGRPADGSACPLALAFRDATGVEAVFCKGRLVLADSWEHHPEEGYSLAHNPREAPLPEAARQFIEAFDAGRAVAPGIHWLPVPSPTWKGLWNSLRLRLRAGWLGW